jgi:hypothetical protein
MSKTKIKQKYISGEKKKQTAKLPGHNQPQRAKFKYGEIQLDPNREN